MTVSSATAKWNPPGPANVRLFKRKCLREFLIMTSKFSTPNNWHWISENNRPLSLFSIAWSLHRNCIRIDEVILSILSWSFCVVVDVPFTNKSQRSLHISQMKHQLDATLCRFYFCRVTLHVSGASAHHQEYLKLVNRSLVHVLSLQVSHHISLLGPKNLMQHCAGFISAESLYMFRASSAHHQEYFVFPCIIV